MGWGRTSLVNPHCWFPRFPNRGRTWREYLGRVVLLGPTFLLPAKSQPPQCHFLSQHLLLTHSCQMGATGLVGDIYRIAPAPFLGELSQKK